MAMTTTSSPSYADTDLCSPFIPEILDNIMDQLRDDNTTLKQCSTVSRSFHPPSHRNLFYYIELDTPEKVNRLHHLLTPSSNIGRNVRQLAVRPQTKVFLVCNAILADMLGMLPRLNALLWGSWLNLEWGELSSELRAALVNIFKSPSVTAITIRSLDDVPHSVLHSSPVKRLKLRYIRLSKSDPKPIILPQLQVLDIQSLFERWATGVEIITPNLRQLSFTDEGKQIAQQAINTAAGTLERIKWDYNLYKANPDISLRSLRCLRFLTFQVVYLGRKEWEQGFKIISILKDASVSRSLNELTIGFKTYRDNFSDSDWRDMYDSKIWKDLDPILSSISSLQRVLIEFNFDNYYNRDIPKQFWAGMRTSMPLLEERGILALTKCYARNLEHDIWY